MLSATVDLHPQRVSRAIHQEFAEDGVCSCVAFVYTVVVQTSLQYNNNQPVPQHGRINTHADGGLSTISQRCGTVRAWEHRAISRLSSGASGVGIEAACVEHPSIKREICDRQTYMDYFSVSEASLRDSL